MEYIEALKKGMNYTDETIKDACLDISTEMEEYHLSFIRFETKDLLGIDWTRSDGTEGFVVLNKKYIISIAVVYQGDISIEKYEEDTSHDVSYS